MNYYVNVLKNYAVFSGRAQRAEYWYFVLFNIIVAILIAIISGIIGDTKGFLTLIYAILVFVPHLAVVVRRLHDVGKSGWMILLVLIPIIGSIWLFVLLVSDSIAEDNKYGPNPKKVLKN